eukprot:g3691.t1
MRARRSASLRCGSICTSFAFAENASLTARLDALEIALREAERRSDMKLEVASEELAKMIKKAFRAERTPVKIPKEAPISRFVERVQPYRATGMIQKPRFWHGRGYGKHPFLVRSWKTLQKEMKKRPSMAIPGKVARPTQREQMLRRMLIGGTAPEVEQFDRVIQVFAQRARQEVRYPLLIQRQEYAKRAKGWAWEMLLNDLVPSRKTYKLLILAFGATGNHAAARWWIEWQKKAYGEAGLCNWQLELSSFL